jgi:hypothetical protein
MAKINLRELKPEPIVKSLKGQKIYLYGSNDTGKTFQSAKLPKPLLLMTEPGGNAVACPKQTVTKWAIFKDIVSQLTSERVDKNDKDGRFEWETMQDLFLTIIIDTVDNLVDEAEKSVCQEFGVRDLSEIDKSEANGWAIYRKDFKTQIDRLCQFGYTVVFIGHEEVETRDENGNTVTKKTKGGTYYEFVQPKGSGNEKSSTRFVRDMCDFCMYLRPNGIDENGVTIPSTAICKETKFSFGRSRYAIQTYIDPFNAVNLQDAIFAAIEKTAKDEGASLCGWEKKDTSLKAQDWIDMIKPYMQAIFTKSPEFVQAVVEEELGTGKKVSAATDEDVTQLENIYNKLVTFAANQQIKFE